MSKLEGSAINRFVGGDEAAQASAEQYFAKGFAEQEIPQLRNFERSSTPEELEIFGLADRAINDFLGRRYGLKPLEIPPTHLHLIAGSRWKKFNAQFGIRQDIDGWYAPSLQAAALKEDSSRLVMASKSVHEMLHLKSFQSWDVGYGPDKTATANLRRFGLGAMTAEREEDFWILNEAITVELEKRVVEELRQDSIFEGEVAETSSVVQEEELDPQEIIVARKVPRKFWFGSRTEWRACAYPKSRAALNHIVDVLYEKNREVYKDREAVFDLFAQGYLTGTLLPLARVIEKTFGAGTFRRLGECRTEKDLLKFANSLKV